MLAPLDLSHIKPQKDDLFRTQKDREVQGLIASIGPLMNTDRIKRETRFGLTGNVENSTDGLILRYLQSREIQRIGVLPPPFAIAGIKEVRPGGEPEGRVDCYNADLAFLAEPEDFFDLGLGEAWATSEEDCRALFPPSRNRGPRSGGTPPLSKGSAQPSWIATSAHRSEHWPSPMI